MEIMNSNHSRLTLFACLLSIGALSFPSASAASTSSNSFDPRSVSPLYNVFGSTFGCTVEKSNDTVEVRVTSARSVKKAKRLIRSGRRVRGVAIGSVRLVHRSQSLVNFLAAWQYASNSLASQYFGAFEGATKWVSSPVVPTSRSKCRSVVVSVYSYPQHEATSDEINWANSVAARYPNNVVTDIQTVPSAPVISQ